MTWHLPWKKKDENELKLIDLQTLQSEDGRVQLKMTLINMTSGVEHMIALTGDLTWAVSRPLLPYELMAYASDHDELQYQVKNLQRELTGKNLEIAKYKKKLGTPVEAGKDDKLFLVSKEFQGSLESALEEAGMSADDLGEGVFRVQSDIDDDEEENPSDLRIHVFEQCEGHQYQPHPNTLMVEYPFEEGQVQCPLCGLTRRMKR